MGVFNGDSAPSPQRQGIADTGYQYGYGDEAAAVMSQGWNDNLFSKAVQTVDSIGDPDEKDRIIQQNSDSTEANARIIKNSPNTFAGGAVQVGGGIASALIDPVNIPLAMLSGGTSMLARAAIPALETARVAANAGNIAAKAFDGTIHGSAFMAPYVATKAILSNQLDQPYSLSDAATDFAFGTVLGAGTEGGIEGLGNFLKPNALLKIAQEATSGIMSGNGFDLQSLLSLHPDVVAAELHNGQPLSPDGRMALLKARLNDDRPITDIYPGVKQEDIINETHQRASDLLDSIKEKSSEPVLNIPEEKAKAQEAEGTKPLVDDETSNFLKSSDLGDLVPEEAKPSKEDELNDQVKSDIEKSKQNNPLPFEEPTETVKDDSGRSRTEYDDHGNIFIKAGTDGDYQDHELIHAAHLQSLKDDWETEGKQGKFTDYVKQRMSEIHDDIKSTADKAISDGDQKTGSQIKKAVANSINLYEGADKVKPGDAFNYLKSNPEKVPHFAAEMVRQFVELRKNESISEPAFKGASGKLVDWVKKAYSHLLGLKDSVGEGALGDSLAKAIRDTESKLKGIDTSDVKPVEGKGAFFAPQSNSQKIGEAIVSEMTNTANAIKEQIRKLDEEYKSGKANAGLFEKDSPFRKGQSAVIDDATYQAEKKNLISQLKAKASDINATKGLWGYLSKNEGKLGKALEYFLDSGADMKGISGARRGIDQLIAGITDSSTKNILNAFRGTKFFKAFKNGTFDNEFANGMHDLDFPDREARKQIPKEVMDVIKKLKDVQDGLRERVNRAGGNISKFDGYVARTTHDQDKIARAGGNKPGSGEAMNHWREFIKPLLHPDYQLDNEALNNSYHNLATGVHLKDPTLSLFPESSQRGTGLAGKINQSKTFIFKDGDAWQKYNQKFGTGNAFESYVTGITQMSRATGLLENMGSNPKKFIDDSLLQAKHVLRANQDYDGLKDLESRENLIKNSTSNITGENNVGYTNTISRWGAGLRALQSFKLGGMVFSAIPDIRNTVRNAQHWGIKPAEAMGKLVETLGQNLSSEEAKEMHGLFQQTSTDFAGGLARHSDGGVDGSLSKMAEKFIHLTGIHIWDDNIKQWMTNMLSFHLGNHSGKAMDELPEQISTMLKARDITSSEWDNWRSGVQDRGSNKALGLDQYEQGYDKQAMAALARQNGVKIPAGDAGDVAIQRYRDNLYTRLRAMFVDESSFAVPHGGARERAMLIGNSQKGTVWGEVRRCVAQFKTFPLAAVTKIGAREFNSYANLKEAASQMPWYLAQCAAIGYISLASKDLVNGKKPQPVNWGTMGQGLMQSAGFGIYGDILWSNLMENHYGQSALDTVTGPAIGTVNQAVQLAHDVVQGKSSAKSDVVKFVRDNLTPGHSLPVVKGAMDYLIFNHLLELSHPGYLKALSKKASQDGTPYLTPQDAFSGQ